MQRFFVHTETLSPTADACGTGMRLQVYQIGDKHLCRALWDPDSDFVQGPADLWPTAMHFPSLEAFAYEIDDDGLTYLADEGISGVPAAAAYKADDTQPYATTKVINVLRGLRDKYGIPYTEFDISPES
jgi:hypothetical protein